MQVHLPDGTQVIRYGDERRWQERRRVFGLAGKSSRWQEQTADALSAHGPAYTGLAAPNPAGTRRVAERVSWLGERLRTGNGMELPTLATDAVSPVSRHLSGVHERLRLFVDAHADRRPNYQTQGTTNALYGRVSVGPTPARVWSSLQGGMGASAHTLAEAVRRNGGRVLYRQEAGLHCAGDRSGREPVEASRRRAKGQSVAADRVDGQPSSAMECRLGCSGEDGPSPPELT